MPASPLARRVRRSSYPLLVPGFLLGLLVLGILVATQIFSARRQELGRWATAHGYVLLTAESRPLRRGPFWLTHQSASVYIVALRDTAGLVHRGYARVGGVLFGPRIEVRDLTP